MTTPTMTANTATEVLMHPERFLELFTKPSSDLKPIGIQKALDILKFSLRPVSNTLPTLPSHANFLAAPIDNKMNPFYRLSDAITKIDRETSRSQQSNWNAAGRALMITAFYIASAAATVLAIQLAVSSIFYLLSGHALGFAFATNASVAIDTFLTTTIAKKVAIYVSASIVFGYMTNKIANNQYEISIKQGTPSEFHPITKLFTTLFQPALNAYDRKRISVVNRNYAIADAESSAYMIATSTLELNKEGYITDAIKGYGEKIAAVESYMTSASSSELNNRCQFTTEIEGCNDRMVFATYESKLRKDIDTFKAVRAALAGLLALSTELQEAHKVAAMDSPGARARERASFIVARPFQYPFGWSAEALSKG